MIMKSKEERILDLGDNWYTELMPIYFNSGIVNVPEEPFELMRVILKDKLKTKNIRWSGKTGLKYDKYLKAIMSAIHFAYKYNSVIEISQNEKKDDQKPKKIKNYMIIQNLITAFEELDFVLIKGGFFYHTKGKKVPVCTKIAPFIDPYNLIFFQNFPHPKPELVRALKTYERKDVVWNEKTRKRQKIKINKCFFELPNEGPSADILLSYNDFAEQFIVSIALEKGEHKLLPNFSGNCILSPYLQRKYTHKGKVTREEVDKMDLTNQYGRLYCYGPLSYQQISSDARTNILINGKKTIEIDFSGQAFNIIRSLEGLEALPDVYDIFNDLNLSEDDYKLLRSVSKLAGVPIMGSSSFKQCQSAVEYKISEHFKNDMDEFYRFKSLVPCYDFMEDNKSALKVISRNILERFINKHSEIKQHFFIEKAKMVQFIDSGIALNIIDRMKMDYNILTLCIHDSFIVDADFKEELTLVMKEEYKKVLKQDIGVK